MHEALGARKAVIGVAKAAFAEGSAVPVLRGDSSRPLFVTAAGMNADGAAELRAAFAVPWPHKPLRVIAGLRWLPRLPQEYASVRLPQLDIVAYLVPCRVAAFCHVSG